MRESFYRGICLPFSIPDSISQLLERHAHVVVVGLKSALAYLSETAPTSSFLVMDIFLYLASQHSLMAAGQLEEEEVAVVELSQPVVTHSLRQPRVAAWGKHLSYKFPPLLYTLLLPPPPSHNTPNPPTLYPIQNEGKF